MEKCIYCGSKAYAGGTCFKSPIKIHVVEKDKHCIVIPSFIERNMLKSMTPNFG